MSALKKPLKDGDRLRVMKQGSCAHIIRDGVALCGGAALYWKDAPEGMRVCRVCAMTHDCGKC